MSRGIDSMLANYGFRIQYNRMFKPEYLPARIKYNGFFFFTGIAIMYGLNKKNVSSFNARDNINCDHCCVDVGFHR